MTTTKAQSTNERLSSLPPSIPGRAVTTKRRCLLSDGLERFCEMHARLHCAYTIHQVKPTIVPLLPSALSLPFGCPRAVHLHNKYMVRREAVCTKASLLSIVNQPSPAQLSFPRNGPCRARHRCTGGSAALACSSSGIAGLHLAAAWRFDIVRRSKGPRSLIAVVSKARWR